MSTIIQDVQLQIDETGGPVFWVIDQLYDAVNAAQLETWMTLKDWQRIGVPITLVANADLFSISGLGSMIPQFIVYNGIKIFITTTAQLQDWQNNWKSELPSQPNWALLWDESHLRFYPPPDIAYAMTLYGVPWPTEVGDDAQDITGIDPLVRRAIVLRAASKLLATTQPDVAEAKVI